MDRALPPHSRRRVRAPSQRFGIRRRVEMARDEFSLSQSPSNSPMRECAPHKRRTPRCAAGNHKSGLEEQEVRNACGQNPIMPTRHELNVRSSKRSLPSKYFHSTQFFFFPQISLHATLERKNNVCEALQAHSRPQARNYYNQTLDN